MMNRIFKHLLICALVVTAFQSAADSTTAQDRTTLRKKVFFQKGRTTAILKNTIRKGTNHHYLLSASEGQTMILHLAAKQTSLTVYKPDGGEAIEDADGVNDWTGTLPETGEYTIEVATDAKAAPYTLEVTIR
jgi:hypothetical protein